MKATSLAILIVWLLCVALGAVLWPYTINTWLTILGKPPTVEWWHGLILGILPVFSQLTIPAAVVTWVLVLFI